VIINPEIVDHKGRQVGMWEGCISFSSLNAPVFAKASRWPEVKARYYDEKGIRYEKWLSGLAAHVFQHETDHCNGILFVDRVKDSTTWMNASEYKKMRKNKRKLESKK
jgi:peptide deformylase